MSGPATFTRGRKIGIAFNVILASILAPALGAFLSYLAFRPEFRARFDLTGTSSYTLSERTRRVLDNLRTDVSITTCFYAHNLNSAGMPVLGLDRVIYAVGQHTNDLIREYELKSHGKLKSHVYDYSVTRHTGRIAELSSRIGEQASNIVVVESGSRRKVLRLADIADYDEGAKGRETYRAPRLYGFKAEEAISGALLSVTEEKPVRIRFIQGHGERDPAARSMDGSGRGGFSRFAAALQAQNFDVGSVNLADQVFTPDDAEILILASPTLELSEAELEQLGEFVRAGGNMMLLFDPATPIALDFSLLDQLLGLKRLPGVVCIARESGGWQRDPVNFHEVDYGFNSEVVRLHRDRGFVTRWIEACAFEPIGRSAESNFEILPLVWTSAESWLDLGNSSQPANRQFDPASEVKRRRGIAFSVERPEGARVLVVGDSDFLDDLRMGEAPGNRDLGLNAMEWLAEREQLISVAPQPYDELRVDLTADEYGTVRLYVVILIPGLALIAGFAVYWTRRQ